MLGPKFADAVTKRFAGKSGAEGSAEEEATEPASESGDEGDASADSELGNMLNSALKKGDGAGICEAVRKIAGV